MKLVHDRSIVFRHQLWNRDRQLLWEYTSKSDTATKVGECIAIYREAVDSKATSVELVDLEIGVKRSTIKIPMPFINLTHIENSVCLFGDPQYNIVVYDLAMNNAATAISFGEASVGELHFAVDHGSRQILACWTNNYKKPESKIAVFDY